MSTSNIICKYISLCYSAVAIATETGPPHLINTYTINGFYFFVREADRRGPSREGGEIKEMIRPNLELGGKAMGNSTVFLPGRFVQRRHPPTSPLSLWAWEQKPLLLD